MMTFPAEISTANYVEVHATMDEPLSELTICMDIRAHSATTGPFFSYAIPGRSNELTALGRHNADWYKMLIGDTQSDRFPLPIRVNTWHVLCVTWRSEDGDWAFYIDGRSVMSGSGLATGHLIGNNGVWILGQEQDSLRGGFSTNEAYRGDLARFNVWDYVLSSEEMDGFHGCRNGGNVIDWDTVTVTPHMDVVFSDLNCSTADVQLDWEFWTLGDYTDRFQGGDMVTMEYNLKLTSQAALVNITFLFHSDDFEDMDPITVSGSSGRLELNGTVTTNIKGSVVYGQKLFLYMNVTYTVDGYGVEHFLGPVCPNSNTTIFPVTGALPTFNTSWMSDGNLTYGDKINMSIAVAFPRLSYDRLVVEVYRPTVDSILPIAITHVTITEVGNNLQLSGWNSTALQSAQDDRWLLELTGISTIGTEGNFLNLAVGYEFTKDEEFWAPKELWARAAVDITFDRTIWTGALPITVVPRGKPVLVMDASVTDTGNLGRGEMVTFNVDLRHDPNSTAAAHNVTMKLISTPYVKYVSLGRMTDGPRPTVIVKANKILFKWPELKLDDWPQFTFKMRIDPDQKERPGDHRFVGPVETLYRGTALQGKRLRTEAKLLQFFYKIVENTERQNVPEFREKSFLVDSQNNKVYFCNYARRRKGLNACFAHDENSKSEHENWRVLSPLLGSLLGVSRAESQLYGVSHCGRAYMMSEDDGRNWFSVPRDDWTRARGTDYVPAMEVREGENADGSTAHGTTWRANDTGILRLPVGETSWQQVASWT
ncbi:uncharacterized protein LOC144873379 [Branchiostoma floridae x Branchiostoma japonicum]